jgi:hypothetical protein
VKQLWVVVLALLAACAVAVATPATHDWRVDIAVRDSFSHVHPRMRASWLSEHGLDDSPYTTEQRPDSGGLRLVGKYGRGPAVEVTGRGSTVFLALGSEVAIVSFAVPDSPTVLAELQAPLRVSNVALKDTFLLVGVGSGVDVWNIAIPSAPSYCERIDAPVSDLCVQDSLLCTVGSDSFRTFVVTDPTNPRRLGVCFAPGSGVAVSGNKAVVYYFDYTTVVDISDPAHPASAGTYGAFALGLAMRGNTVCANVVWNTLGDHFRYETWDISNPSSIRRLGSIDSVGGYDIHWDGPLAFVSGYYYNWDFTIVDMSDSAHPSVVSTCATPGDGWGVWADWTSDWAYVADYTGLTAVNISNLNQPVVDTCIMKANSAVDVCVDGGIAYVADYIAGMKIVDVSDPTRPQELAGVDTTESQRSVVEAVVARDSFAYMGWPNWTHLLAVDVSNPAHPVKVGKCDSINLPEAMKLRDSLLYIAARMRFWVVNVARPREPVLVGSCVIQGTGVDVVLSDTLAYVSSLPTQIVNISNPAAPVVVGTMPPYGYGVALRDTFLFLPAAYDSMVVYSVANPAAPVKLARMTFSGEPGDATHVYVSRSGAACAGGRGLAVLVSDSRPCDAMDRSCAGWLPEGKGVPGVPSAN